MKHYEIDLAKLNGKIDRLYSRLVSEKIRAKYPLDAELAILRQRDEKPEEFTEYNAFAEQCKAEAKTELGIEVTSNED